ncbi:MAG TPA: amidase [Jiangellaceae bacterium]
MGVSRRHLLGVAGAGALGSAAGLLGPAASAAAGTVADAVASTANRRSGPPPRGEELCFLPATELADLMRRRRVSPVEVAQAHLDRIARVNPDINAYVTLIDPDAVLAQARAAEKRIRSGEARALEGLPVAVKDLFDFLAGVRNTFGSVPMKELDFVPPFTAVYVQRLLDAGAIPIGKTNTPEFGHEGTTDNFAFGPTRNPFDLDYNAGGSSGGSAAAMAAFLAPISQGSDAGGSVRIPAAMCGIVGFKATFGRIPQDAPPLAHTPFLHPGPMTRTVADAALLMDVMAQPYSGDPLSLSEKLDYSRGIRGSIKGKKIAFSPDLDLFPVEPEVDRVVRASLDAFRDAGAVVDEVSLGLDKLVIDGRPVTQSDLSDLWVQEQSVLYAHAVDLLRLYVGVDLLEHAATLNPEFLGMIERGMATSAREYRYGDFLRADVLHTVEAIFDEYDYIVSPTLSVVGVRNTDDGNTLGPADVEGVPVDRLIGWCLTYIYNFTGHPAISVPAGLAANGLPVGLQIAGRRWADVDVLSAASVVEQRRDWSEAYPRG